MNRRTFLKVLAAGPTCLGFSWKAEAVRARRAWVIAQQAGAPLSLVELSADEAATWNRNRVDALCFSAPGHAVGLRASQVDDRLLSAEFWRVEYRPNALTEHQVNLLRSRVRLGHSDADREWVRSSYRYWRNKIERERQTRVATVNPLTGRT